MSNDQQDQVLDVMWQATVGPIAVSVLGPDGDGRYHVRCNDPGWRAPNLSVTPDDAIVAARTAYDHAMSHCVGSDETPDVTINRIVFDRDEIDVLVRAKAGAVLAARVRDQFGHAEAPYTPWALEALADYDATTARIGADEPDEPEPEPERTKLTVDVEALGEHYGPVQVAAAACRLAGRPDLADSAAVVLMSEAVSKLVDQLSTDRAEHHDIVEALGTRCVTLEQEAAEWRSGLAVLQHQLDWIDEREKKRRDEHHVRVIASTVRPGSWTSRCSCGHDVGQARLSTLGEQLENIVRHLGKVYAQ